MLSSRGASIRANTGTSNLSLIVLVRWGSPLPYWSAAFHRLGDVSCILLGNVRTDSLEHLDRDREMVTKSIRIELTRLGWTTKASRRTNVAA